MKKSIIILTLVLNANLALADDVTFKCKITSEYSHGVKVNTDRDFYYKVSTNNANQTLTVQSTEEGYNDEVSISPNGNYVLTRKTLAKFATINKPEGTVESQITGTCQIEQQP